jgi:carboxypeptidase Q
MSTKAIEFLRPVQDILQSFGANMIKAVAFSPGSDISAMAQGGVPTLGIMQDGRTYFNYHHSPADTLDKIEPGALRENAAAMAVMGYALACTAEPLPR